MHGAWAESAPPRIVRIGGNCVGLQNNSAFAAFDDKHTAIGSHYIHDVARFFEVLNGGALHPEYNLILKAASLHAARALDAHNEEAREHDARGGDVARLLSQSCELRSLCNGRTEHNDISRDTAIKPEQWKADVAAGEWFVCAEPKASCGAGNGACGLRPANSPAAA